MVRRSAFAAAAAAWACLGALPARAAVEPAPAASPSAAPRNPAAAAAFREGRFVEAEALYRAGLDRNAGDPESLLRLGEIALLCDRLSEAEALLRRSLAAEDAKRAHRLLGECLVRQGRFEDAATAFAAAGEVAEAKKLRWFSTRKPYEHAALSGPVTVPFERTDPLPVLKAAVNGIATYFFIDTGAAEITLDPELADRAKAARFGDETGTFGGGKKASVGLSAVDEVSLGGLSVRNVPVQVLDTKRFASIFGLPVEGIVGTRFLYRFRATLDYPGGALVLEPRGAAPALPSGASEVPFWMAGDHFLVAWGTMNGGPSRLWFVDTGLAGSGLAPSSATAKECGLTVDEGRSREGIGGGGKVKVVPFVAEQATLGDVRREGVPGVHGAFPDSLSEAFGFRLAGIVSHVFFRPFALTFDFDRMRLVIARPAKRAPS